MSGRVFKMTWCSNAATKALIGDAELCDAIAQAVLGQCDDLGGGVESAGNVVKQIDQSLRVAQNQVKEAAITTQSVWAGVQAAWKSLKKTSQKRKRREPTQPLPSKSERRGSTGDRSAPNNRPTSTGYRKSSVDYPEVPSTSVKPSGRSRAEQRHDASSLDAPSSSEKHIEPLPENPSSPELE